MKEGSQEGGRSIGGGLVRGGINFIQRNMDQSDIKSGLEIYKYLYGWEGEGLRADIIF